MGVWLSARGILEIYQGSQGANPPQIAPDRPERITLFHSEAEAEQWWRSAIAAAQPSPATLAPPPDIAVSPPVPAHPSVSTQQVPATSAPPPVTAVVSPPIPAHPVTTDTTTILSSAVTSPAAPPICSYCAQPVRAEAKICSQCGSPRYPLTRLRPGELLNRRYTVKRAISRGGMGEIYLAVDGNVFGRHVVIKVMLDYFDAGDVVEAQAAQQMFEREAQTLAALSHPAIPKIHDFFQIKADAFIVMEHIAGDNLEAHLTHADMAQRRVPGHPYPTEVGIRYGLEIARVLQYLAAIESGPVVHQDIKPANLLLDPTGIIRLVDFGTARPQTAVKGNARGAGQTTAYGTPGYAPREQYQGQTEPRSDIYALAATIYHLVTDDDPRAHPFSFPHLSQLGLLGHVLTKALSERVDQRPDAQAFAGELQQLPTRVTAEAQQEQDRIEAARRKAEEATQRQAQIDADRRRDKEAAQRQAQIDADRRKADAEARQRQAQIEAARRKAETEAQQQQALIENERRKADAEAAQRQAQIDADRRELEVQKERDWLRRAPDGTLLLSADDLLRWSEQHWQHAIAWLEDEQQFLQQVGAICGTKIGSTLRSTMRNRTMDTKSYLLDAILAQLDPTGFGLEQAQIVVDRTKIPLNFGEITPHEERRIAVMVKNPSRRHLKLEIAGPSWLRLAKFAVEFLPGEEHEVTFIAQASADNASSISTDTAEMLVNGSRVGVVRVNASAPRRGLFARLRRR
ncbi:MAG: protein kinase [Chloroflexales bacterium]